MARASHCIDGRITGTGGCFPRARITTGSAAQGTLPRDDSIICGVDRQRRGRPGSIRGSRPTGVARARGRRVVAAHRDNRGSARRTTGRRLAVAAARSRHNTGATTADVMRPPLLSWRDADVIRDEPGGAFCHHAHRHTGAGNSGRTDQRAGQTSGRPQGQGIRAGATRDMRSSQCLPCRHHMPRRATTARIQANTTTSDGQRPASTGRVSAARIQA